MNLPKMGDPGGVGVVYVSTPPLADGSGFIWELPGGWSFSRGGRSFSFSLLVA